MASSRKRRAQGQNGDHYNPKAQKHDTNMLPGRLQEYHEGPGDEGYDVAVVGSGPAGLMLAANLVRFGINLAWKLNLDIRGLGKPELLSAYEDERRKVAKDLIESDYEHANAFHDGDPAALANNFLKNVRFISGVGAEYHADLWNYPLSTKTAV